MPTQQEPGKKRWLSWLLLVVAIAGLGGLTFFPIISELLSGNSAEAPTASPTAITSPEAVTEAQKQKLVELEKAYRTVLEREPTNETTFKGLIETLNEMVRLGIKDRQDYINALATFVQNNPNNHEYKLLLATAYQETHQREAASTIYTEILAKEPGNILALQGTTSLLEPTAAVKVLNDTLETAKQTEPGTIDVPGVKLLLGKAYVDQKDFKQALTVYDEMINESPQDWRPLYAKGTVLAEQGNPDDAKKFFDLAANLAPAQLKPQLQRIAEQAVAPSPSPSAPATSGATPAPDSATPAEPSPAPPSEQGGEP